MPLTISVVMLKGGVGKTTTAIALAEAAASQGAPVVLVDSDPMGAARRWSELAADPDTGSPAPLASTVVGMSAADLPRRLRHAIAPDVACVVIDSPPPGALHIARGAIDVADILVIPSTPNMGDLDRVRPTVAEADGSRIPARVVLTMTRPTADRAEARDILAAWQVPVFTAELPMRAVIARNYGRPPAGILADYGAALMSEVLDLAEGGRR